MSIGLKKFEECIEKVTYGNKIQRTEYLDKGKFPVVSQESKLINGFWNNEEDLYVVNQPVIVFGDHTRILKFIDFSFVLGADGTKIIKPKNFIDSKFFYYFLEANPIKSKGYSRHYRFLKELKINVPSLAIQKKIVAKLDAIFAEIDTASVAAEAIAKNAELFFISYLNSIFNNKNTELLKNISQINMGQSPIGESYNDTGEGVPLINGPVEFGKDAFSKTIKTKFTTHPTKMCKEGDLILCVRGSTTGRMNIAGFDACIGRGVASIRANDSQEWINYFIFANRNLIYSLGTGSTFPNVSSASIGNLKIFNPSLTEKNKFILNFDIAKASTDIIRINSKNKIKQLKILKQSILKKAFSGELVKD